MKKGCDGVLIEKIVKKVFQRYWRLSRGLTLGVKAVVLDDTGRVLVIRPQDNWRWTLPNAKVRRGEAAEDTLRRMLEQALSIEPLAPPSMLGLAADPATQPSGHWVILAVRSWRRNVSLSSGQLIEVRWLKTEQLFTDLSPDDAAAVALLLGSEVATQKG